MVDYEQKTEVLNKGGVGSNASGNHKNTRCSNIYAKIRGITTVKPPIKTKGPKQRD